MHHPQFVLTIDARLSRPATDTDFKYWSQPWARVLGSQRKYNSVLRGLMTDLLKAKHEMQRSASRLPETPKQVS